MRQVYLDTDPNNAIEKISFFSASQGYVAFDKWIGYSSDSGHTFTQKYITNSNVNYNGYSVNLTFGFGIAGVKAFNQNSIIVYGDYGLVPAILTSTDGGNNFTLVFYSQFDPLQFRTGITDMIFPQTSSVGYAVDADRILKTIDKGLTWSVVATSAAQYFSKLEAVDNNYVFAISTAFGSSVLYKTANAGSSWQNMTLPVIPGGGTLSAAFPLSTAMAWIDIKSNNSNSYYVYKTTNGGSSWVLQNNDVTSFGTEKMKFTDSNTGYAITGQNTVAKTLNSGALWEPLPRDNNYSYLLLTHNDMQILGTQVWAGGGHGFLELNTNPGGPTLPLSRFGVDTTGVDATNIVQLKNYSNSADQFKWYVNNNLISTSYNSFYTHALASTEDSIKLVVTSGSLSDSVTQYQYFNLPVLPNPVSFSPTTGGTGTQIIITGTGFTGVTGVSFGNVAAQSFIISSATQILAIVGNGATGSVSLTDRHGTYSIPGFTYISGSGSVPPAISSFSPESGPIGASVTISGSNFGATPAENIVFFGAVKATIQSASASQIVCTVPLGGNLSSLNLINITSGLQSSSVKPFHITFPDSTNFNANSFVPAYAAFMSSTESPKYVKGKDLDGDGKPDLLVSDLLFCDSMLVYRNTTVANNFSFTNKINLGLISCGAGNAFFATDDLDGDGKPDIVAATNQTNIKVFKNNSIPGSIIFNAPVTIPISNDGTQDVVIKDFDNDGKPDLAVAAYNYSLVTILKNTSSPGAISFGAPFNIPAGGNTKKMAAGDLDGDGKTDLVMYNYGNPGIISYSRNTSTLNNISFSPPINITGTYVNSQGFMVEIYDYDNDGKPDIIIMDDREVCIYKNTGSIGNISFAAPVIYPFVSNLSGGSLGDLNGDSKPDMFSGAWTSRQYELIQNLSTTGNIISNTPVIVTPQTMNIVPFNMDATDYNMDGKPDLATSSAGDREIVIYKNNVGALVINSICAGQTVHLDAGITGSSYQWQMDSGAGFNNITDGSPFSGTSTASLTITNPSSGLADYKFRCVSGINYSASFILQFNRWTGNVNSSWENLGNWSCGVLPDANTDVVIPSGGTCIVSSNAICRSLTVMPGAIFTVNPGYGITIVH